MLCGVRVEFPSEFVEEQAQIAQDPKRAQHHGGGHLSLSLVSLSCLPALSTCEPKGAWGEHDRYKRNFLAPDLGFMRVLRAWRAYRSPCRLSFRLLCRFQALGPGARLLLHRHLHGVARATWRNWRWGSSPGLPQTLRFRNTSTPPLFTPRTPLCSQ